MSSFQIIYINPVELIDYEKNNKIHTEEDTELLAALISEVGFDVPIVADENKVIIKGHLRKRAAVNIGLDKVPCIIRDDMTEEQKRLARIADNKFPERSQWHYEFVREEINYLKEMGIDLSLTGFNVNELKVITDLDEDFSFNSNYDNDETDSPDSNIEGSKDGRSYLCEIAFSDKESAEKFLRYIGLEDWKFKGLTKLVDGNKIIIKE
ncbi:hypothetical protein D9V86_11725 [Bacteroidetes/Chlorobi group bacterium ChocPot_Mid]|nr:MAG: hypothetical protein D9V86_11725 [Bacteroidetes/Chlorobi group bacterium ChocPot_Mid]